MKRTAHTTLAAWALPLLLLLLASQGGSCGAGRATADDRNQAGPARSPSPNPGGGGSATRATPSPAASASDAGNLNAAGAGAGDNAGGAGRGAGGDTAMNDGQKRRLADGVWGGVGVRLDVNGGSARIEFDCAHGTLGEVALGPDGRFTARGTLARERGGPVRLGEEAQSAPATYAGRVEGETMTLRVSAKGDDDMDYTLRRGSDGRLRKCL